MRPIRVAFALILALALAACTAPIQKGPRNLNDALLDAHERDEARSR